MNQLTGFAFENHVAHGAFVELELGVAELLDHRPASVAVGQLLREVLAAMPLLATHLSFDGRINLQFQGEGQMKLLVGQVDQALNVRAMSKAPADLEGNFTELLYNGILALMIEPNDRNRAASQAVVLIRGERLSDALELYFAESEQLPTLVRLAVRGDRVCGFLLQRQPLNGIADGELIWEHLATLADTLGDDELLDTPPHTLLRRLFHEESVRVFEPRTVTVACRCSRDSISRMLISMGRDEVDSIVADQGQVEVTCEFCGRQYRYSPLEATALFARTLAAPANGARLH